MTGFMNETDKITYMGVNKGFLKNKLIHYEKSLMRQYNVKPTQNDSHNLLSIVYF